MYPLVFPFAGMVRAEYDKNNCLLNSLRFSMECQVAQRDGCISVLGRSGDRIERRKRWSKRQTKEGEEDE
jgi:hypothetical protein